MMTYYTYGGLNGASFRAGRRPAIKLVMLKQNIAMIFNIAVVDAV